MEESDRARGSVKTTTKNRGNEGPAKLMKKTTNTKHRSGVSLIGLLAVITILAIFLLLVGACFSGPVIGVFPFGPEKTVTAKVERLYVDYSGGKESSSSHYMVGTDQGVFEVDNSMWLWIWDADERYASLKAGETYRLRVKGRKVLNFFFQQYPGIVSVEKVP